MSKLKPRVSDFPKVTQTAEDVKLWSGLSASGPEHSTRPSCPNFLLFVLKQGFFKKLNLRNRLSFNVICQNVVDVEPKRL